MPKPTVGQSNWGETLNAHLDALASDIATKAAAADLAGKASVESVALKQTAADLDDDVAAKIPDTGTAVGAALSATLAPPERLRSLEGKWRAQIEAILDRTAGYGTSIAAWTSAATTIVGGVTIDPILDPFGAYSLNPVFTYLGATPDRAGASYPAQVTVKGWGLTSAASELPYRVAFMHEGAQVFEARAFAHGGVYNSRLRVWVDGVLINADPVDGPGSGGSEWRTRIALPDDGLHHVILEWSGISTAFSGLVRDPAATVRRWPGPIGARRIAPGDSQMEGQNGIANRIGNPLGFFPLLCQASGVLDYWQSGLGETGLLADGVAGDRANLVTRVADDVVARDPHEVWLFASQNDAGETKAALKTALDTVIDAILTGHPTCQIRLIGNFLPRAGAGLTAVRDAYKEVADERGMLFLDASTFITDTNEADYLVDPGVDDHLSPEGHRAYAAWLLARIEAGYAEPGLTA